MSHEFMRFTINSGENSSSIKIILSSIPRSSASFISSSLHFSAQSLGHDLQTYFQSLNSSLTWASASIISCAPFDVTSPPTVKIIFSWSFTPSILLSGIFNSGLSIGLNKSVSTPICIGTILFVSVPSLLYMSLTHWLVVNIRSSLLNSSW